MKIVDMNSYVALICARGGSKGLPGKNIRALAGKPLLGWAIEHAAAALSTSRVMVSTDSAEIADIAIQYGAEVPFIRPRHLARDDTGEWLVWQHALQWLRDTHASLPDALVVIPVTAPLRQPSDIVRCVHEFEKGSVDVVITVTDAHRSPFFNMVTVGADSRATLAIPPAGDVVRRQDAPPVYDMTTVAYVARSEFVLARDGMFDGRVRAVHIPPERALDIDTPLDFRIAECLMSQPELI